MQRRGSNHRLPALLFRSRISYVMLAMLATMSVVYVAGRLWQDAQNRVYLIKELDRRTGQGMVLVVSSSTGKLNSLDFLSLLQGHQAISVDDTLKVVACRNQHKRLAALEMELVAARQEGFVGRYNPETSGNHTRRRLMAVIGITTGFGQKNNRDAIRKTWLPTGVALKKLEKDKGIVIRFVVGRSANRGDSMDRDIDEENKHTKDFLILDDHVEASEELPKKTKLFFVHAADKWDAEFYAKVNDNIYVNIDGFGAMLASYVDQPRVYIGCMKSGEVFSELSHKWYEPEWWKFGDGKSYFRHASGEIFVISRALAQFMSINRSILRTYAHDDVSAGSWFIGLDVKHINEGKLCCTSWSSGSVCAAV